MKRHVWNSRVKAGLLCLVLLAHPLCAAAAQEAETIHTVETAEEASFEETSATSEEIPETTEAGSTASETESVPAGTEAETSSVAESGSEAETAGGEPETTGETEKTEETEGSTEESSEDAALYGAAAPKISYQTHVQTYGWLNPSSNGEKNGTTGEYKRLEAIKIWLDQAPVSGGVEYRTHVQTYGWLDWVSDGAESGTTKQAKRLEAIQIRLTGELAEKYDIYYRVHCQTFGWTGWAKNGAPAGSEGYAKRLESIEIVLVEKDGPAPGTTEGAYLENLKVVYQTHVQTYGWQAESSNGERNGTTGLAKRLEGIKIHLENHSFTEGNVEYRTHVQTYGWQDWAKAGQVAGTTGEAKRLEAIEIRLTGGMAEAYDIYYRVHCQTFGWTGWGKNGESVGSEGYAKRLEAIEIRLVTKGGAAPGSTENTYYKYHVAFWGMDVSHYQHGTNWKRAKEDGIEFAMLRLTQQDKNGRDVNGTTIYIQKDLSLDDNLMGTAANGIPIGGYVYNFASTPEEARAEAQYAVSLLKGYNVQYPIAFDLERKECMNAASRLNNMAMAKAFCEEIRAAGYIPAVYGSPSKLGGSPKTGQVNKDAPFDYDGISSVYDIWLARYRWSSDVLDFSDAATRQTVYNKGYEGDEAKGETYPNLPGVTMWQFTDKGRVAGVPGNVDLDLCYKVY